MSPSTVRVLGIDPGSQCTGFGVVDALGPRLIYVVAFCYGTSFDLLSAAGAGLRKDMLRDKNDVLRSAPDLLIEVLSPSENKRRKQAKLDDYAKIGVPEVWIVSPEAEIIDILLLKDGRYELDRFANEGELRPTRFSDVAISVAEMWPE